MTLHRWTMAAAASLSLFATAPAYADCKLNQIIELPVTMIGTRPTVTLYINGQPARFLVDSGADLSLIDPAAAAALGLKTVLIDEYVKGVGGEVQMSLTTVKSLGLSKDLSLGRVDMLVAPGAGGNGVVGLIGEGLLGLADIEYDLPHGAIRLFKLNGCQGANLGYWADSAAVELDLTHTGALPPSRDRDPNHYDPATTDRGVRSTAQVNGQKINVTFDSGAELSILTTSAAARAGVTPQSPGAVSNGLGGGIGSKLSAQWIAPFESFALGAEQIKNTRLRFGDLDLGDTDMLLGADFFLSHRIFVANSLSKAFITYVGGPVFNFSGTNFANARTKPAVANADAPKDADAFIRRAAASLGREDYASADADLTQAIALDGKNAAAYVLRAQARAELDAGKAEYADLDQALRLDPANLEGLLARGAWFGANKEPAKAKADLDAAGRLASPDGRARLRAARAYESFAAYDEAIAQYDAQLAADAKGPLAAATLNERCWARAIIKQELDKALADCNAALRLTPQIANFLDSRALVHVRRGELDQAIADYDAAIRLQPKTALTLYARGLAKLSKGLKASGEADIAAAAAAAIEPKIADRAKRIGILADAS